MFFALQNPQQPFYYCLPDETDCVRLFGGGECQQARWPDLSQVACCANFHMLHYKCNRTDIPSHLPPAPLAVRISKYVAQDNVQPIDSRIVHRALDNYFSGEP